MLQGVGRSHWCSLLPFSPVCGLGVPPVPLSISCSCSSCCLVSMTRGLCSTGMDAGRDAGSRLQTGSTGRSKMHPGTCGRGPRKQRVRALEGMQGCRSRECSSSHHSIPECCICSERLTENLLIWQPCMGECPSHSPLHPLPGPSAPHSPEPCSVPSQHGTLGATQLIFEGVKYSQIKQNAVHSGKIIPAF